MASGFACDGRYSGAGGLMESGPAPSGCSSWLNIASTSVYDAKCDNLDAPARISDRKILHHQ